MDIKIQGSNSFNVSGKIEEYIKKRMEKLNFFKTHIEKVTFHLESEKLLYKITAALILKKLGTYKFEAAANEMYTAIDKIIHKMDVKINREKSKIQKHSNLGHQEIVELFFEHDKNMPEPTKEIAIEKKPTALMDAYLQMKLDGSTFHGFTLIQADNSVSPAFLRKIEDDHIYLFKQESNNSYSEYSLKPDENSINEEKKIRTIELKSMSLLDAQKDVLEQDYHYNVYIDEANNKINFLLKEGNGKWKLIS